MKPPRSAKDIEHPAEFYFRRWLLEVEPAQVPSLFFSSAWAQHAERLSSGDLIRVVTTGRQFEFVLSVEKPRADAVRVSLHPKIPSAVYEAVAAVEEEQREIDRKAVAAERHTKHDVTARQA